MQPALLQERGIKMTTTSRTSRTRRKRNTGTLNVKINACQECGNKKPLLKVDKNFFIKCENCGKVLYEAYKMAYWRLLKSGMREIAGND